jgi:hypothetical protein
VTPPIIKITAKMERKAASVLPIFHFSNFFANGSRINEISKATLSGMRMGFAKISVAKSANTVAIA